MMKICGFVCDYIECKIEKRNEIHRRQLPRRPTKKFYLAVQFSE